MRAAIITLMLGWAAAAHAQAPVAPAPAAPEQTGDGDDTEAVLTPTRVDTATCFSLDLTPGALLRTTSKTSELELATPIPWSEFDIQGKLVDNKQVVRALLEPTMQQLRTSLSAATMPQVAAVTARFGYQLLGHTTQDLPNGAKLVLFLAPLPLVRNVEVEIRKQGWFDKLLDDEVRRRMSIRSGSYLAWEPIRRQCALLEERRRIAEFLYDEGYFDAEVSAFSSMEGSTAVVHVIVTLKKAYKIGTVTIACPVGYERRKGICVDPATGLTYSFVVSESEIKKLFVHERCAIASYGCIGPARFSLHQHQDDLQRLRDLFHKRDFPAVRVTSSDPRVSIDTDRKLVNPVLTIDPRRRISIEFQGHDPDIISDDSLRKQLTFYDAGSADDVETAESARAITTYLQTRGFFDARVTWSRERVDIEPRPGTRDVGVHLDNIVFRIDMGRRRRVARVEFVGNHEIPGADLAKLAATKPGSVGGAFLGTVAAATSPELIADQERIKEAYRRAGYPEARVGTSASPSNASLDNAAMTAGLLGVDDGSSLYVRFTIDEGAPTLLTRIVVQLEGGGRPDAALCKEALGALAKELAEPKAALPTDKDKCAATIRDLKFKADDVAVTRERLRDALFKIGRSRARVDYAAVPIGPQRVEARYTLKRVEKLRLGKVIIRGNFRTRKRVIYDQLDFDEGQLLTTDRIADGARKLRAMGLFEAVNLDMPDLECDEDRQCSSEVINAVIRVEERFNHRAELGLEGGWSSLNGFFGTLRPIVPNILGLGMRFELAATLGERLTELDARYRIPAYLMTEWPAPKGFTIDLTGLYRVQDTPRFGVLTTKGGGVALSRVWSRLRTEQHTARAITFGPYYEFRHRSRNVDAFRPVGADMDNTQVAVSTRAGAFGARIDYEQRLDRNGQINPLAPVAGWHGELRASYASPVLLGQDTFAKLSASVSKFQSIGDSVVVRADARYDHGLPLGGAVLLPEVERFFAGGDDTVRGYADDRMEREIIQVPVPPLDNTYQIRVIPQGGNIRALASLDAQAKIWKIMAGALFTDAGLITNQWRTTSFEDIRPSVGMGLRALTPFGIGALEYAIPLRPRLGDDPRGRIHFYFAARAQF